MLSRWQATCRFQNVFMHEHGETKIVKVTAERQEDAERQAKLEACRELGFSTMMHGYFKIVKIENLGRA
jgi:hypothetical protein